MKETFIIKWRENVFSDKKFTLSERPLKIFPLKNSPVNVKLSVHLGENELSQDKSLKVLSLLLHIKGTEQKLLKVVFGSISLTIPEKRVDYSKEFDNIIFELDSTNGYFGLRELNNSTNMLSDIPMTASFPSLSNASSPSYNFSFGLGSTKKRINSPIFSSNPETQHSIFSPNVAPVMPAVAPVVPVTPVVPVANLLINCTCTLIIEEEIDNISTRISSLFSSNVLTDMKIVCCEKEFEVHRAVLAAWSPVFLKMFQSDFQETINGQVNIEDTEPETMELFLKFLYSGQISLLIGHEKEILFLAEKYCIDELKEHCFLLLCQDLTPPKVITYLELAVLYQGDLNRSDITTYFNSNRITVMDSELWGKFMDKYPKECAKFLESSIRRTIIK